jgi:hypothetical protein
MASPQAFTKNAQARLRDIITPRVPRIFDDGHNFDEHFSQIQGLPRANQLGSDNNTRGQGRMDTGSHDHGRDTTIHKRPGCTWLPNKASPRGHGHARPHGSGRLACPDCNRCPFLPNVQCAVCKQVGHVAKHCNMLATAICLERYMKHAISPALRDSIEKEWLDHWKECLGNPMQTPQQGLHTYVEELDITVAGLDNQMEWEFWDDDYFDKPQLK